MVPPLPSPEQPAKELLARIRQPKKTNASKRDALLEKFLIFCIFLFQ